MDIAITKMSYEEKNSFVLMLALLWMANIANNSEYSVIIIIIIMLSADKSVAFLQLA